jgi:hypothetical protein
MCGGHLEADVGRNRQAVSTHVRPASGQDAGPVERLRV